MEYAEESKETTYFDEEAAAAKEAVEGVSRYFNSRVDGPSTSHATPGVSVSSPLPEAYNGTSRSGNAPTDIGNK